MEHQEDSSFDVETLFSTPTDWGLPMSPPSPPPLPLLPSSHMNKEEDVVAQSSAQAAGKKKLEQEFELLNFTCTPTDVELVQDHLLPAIQRMPPEERTPFDMFRRQRGGGVVNPDLPSMDPWELPGIAGNNKGGMRDKYYLTDNIDLRFFRSLFGVRTTNGCWRRHAHDAVIGAEHNRVVGSKMTMKFQTYTGTKTNWVMNVYHSCNKRNSFLQDDLVLCHVFEADSAPDYDDNPKCLGCQPGACSGRHHDQEFGAPSEDTSFNSTQPGYYPKRPSDPRLKSYIAEFENILLGDPDDPDNSADTGNSSAGRGDPPTADHGQSKKRKKISDVWDYFTKIFARDLNGKVVTFAACNHCCKILSGSSKGGTTHLARHTCPCKFKPVAAGRSAKDSGGDVNVLSS